MNYFISDDAIKQIEVGKAVEEYSFWRHRKELENGKVIYGLYMEPAGWVYLVNKLDKLGDADLKAIASAIASSFEMSHGD